MSSKNIGYLSYGNTIDGTTYCSGVETLAENVIEDNEADSVIIYPSANGWARLRSESYRMTTDNAEAVLPLPIYKIRKVLVNIKDFDIAKTVQGETIVIPVSNFKDDEGNAFPEELDITESVVTSEQWKSLPLASNKNDYIKNIRKDNTFYWENAAYKIPFLGTVYKLGAFFVDMFNDNSPSYERLILNVLYRKGAQYKTNIGTLQDFVLSAKLNNIDVRDWQYRIEYVPMTSAFKMRSRKRAETTEEYIQPFNQRAEINSASAFGKNMYLTAQKTGVRELTVVKNYTRLTDIPPLGAIVKHNGKRYRLIANKKKQTNTIYLQVTHTLSEDWTAKSKHVAVDQKYRNWNIPQDMLWRNLYYEDYLCISKQPIDTSHNEDTAGISLDNFMQLFKVSNANDETIDTFAWEFDGYWETDTDGSYVMGVTLPCSTLGIGNSLVFSASMKDQLSAGLREVEENLCEEVRYCEEDGRIDYAKITLSAGMGNGYYEGTTFIEKTDDEDFSNIGRRNLPAVKMGAYGDRDDYWWNVPKSPLFNKTFAIGKTAGEEIKFTYQVHLTPYDSEIVVGNALAENNPLVKKWENNRTFKLWLLREYLREGEDIVGKNNNTAYEQTEDGLYFNIVKQELSEEAFAQYGEVYHLSLKNTMIDYLLNDSNHYVAWAITDENNKLYVGMNSRLNFDLYFQIQHKRR